VINGTERERKRATMKHKKQNTLTQIVMDLFEVFRNNSM